MRPDVPFAHLLPADNARIPERVLPADGTAFGLEELYALLDCRTIQVVCPLNGLLLILDEDGLLRAKPLNARASALWGAPIVGDVLLCPTAMLR